MTSRRSVALLTGLIDVFLKYKGGVGVRLTLTQSRWITHYAAALLYLNNVELCH